MPKVQTVHFPQTIRVFVKQAHIDQAKCRDPNKCMIKLAVKEAIGGHGYVKVDSTGIAITRRPDFREKAFLPRAGVKHLFEFDDGKEVKPFQITLKFFKTTRVYKNSEDRRLQINKARVARISAGRPDKRSEMQKRLRGLAVAASKADAA